MRLLPIFFTIATVIPLISAQWGYWYPFRQPYFDCRRIHAGHCCATRIRMACPAVCRNVPCGNNNNFVPPSHMPSPPPPTSPPPTPAPFTFPTFPTFAPLLPLPGLPGFGPPPEVGVNPMGPDSAGPEPATPLPGPSFGGSGDSNPFPTLIPNNMGGGAATPPPTISSAIEEASISANIEEKPTIGENGSIDGEIHIPSVETEAERKKKKKKKGIIRPPSMPNGEDEIVELEAGETPLPPPTNVAAINNVNSFNPAPSPPSNQPSGGLWAPSSVSFKKVGPLSRDEEEAAGHDPDPAPERTTIRAVSGDGIGHWSFAVKPSGYTAPPVEGIEVPPSEISEEVKAKGIATAEVVEEKPGNGSPTTSNVNGPPTTNSSIFTDKIGTLISSFVDRESLVNLGIAKPRRPPPPPPAWATGGASGTTPPTAPQPIEPIEPVLIETLPQSKLPDTCGKAPDFIPCVPAQKASSLLLDCCKRRLMPPGCLDLCRYDVTQVEIRKAFEQGKCGLLNVAPFLECASNGNNNMECCKHKEVAKKSGPQCEVFCNPAGGITGLGLQHIACQNVIGDLLQCHHSGIRPF
uniref:DB domain-containing protein n=1 Tax=Panagrellus redivivus TaxID=6233 RepID=A0A7E4VGM7_PANRE